MNRSVRRVALVLGLAFAAVLAQLNIVQVGRSNELAKYPSPMNRRLILDEYSIERGQILAGRDVLAESRKTNDRLKYRRRYPFGDLFAHITGYYSFLYGRAGLEASFNDYLTGEKPPTTQDFVDDLLGRERKGNSLVLTIDPELQRVARRALGSQRGGVAAINPTTGAVLALWGSPSYDPNPLASHDLAPMRRAYERITGDRRRVLRSRAYQERYPPGSTFKIVTAAAALELGKMTPSSSFGFARRIDLPDTNLTLGNFGGSTCGGTMIRAMLVSCNTYFALTGMRIGSDKLFEMASRFGLNGPLEFDLPAAQSCVRAAAAGGCSDEELSRPHTAYSSIGQFEVRVTPLQMAIVAAAVENGGYVLRPRVVKEIQDYAGFPVEKFTPERSKRIFSKATAAALKQMLIDVVRSGTGRVVGFRQPGIGGKTGTAQTGVEGQAPHVWFVAFTKGIAVAVVVENGGSMASEATGGRVAGPIAKAVVEAYLAKRR